MCTLYLSKKGGENIFIEKYFPMLTKDIDDANEALTAQLPDQIRIGIEDELRKLQALNAVLSGTEDKSALHQARARLRWARQRLASAKDAQTKKKIEHEIAGIEADIRREVERREKK